MNHLSRQGCFFFFGGGGGGEGVCLIAACFTGGISERGKDLASQLIPLLPTDWPLPAQVVQMRYVSKAGTSV